MVLFQHHLPEKISMDSVLSYVQLYNIKMLGMSYAAMTSRLFSNLAGCLRLTQLHVVFHALNLWHVPVLSLVVYSKL